MDEEMDGSEGPPARDAAPPEPRPRRRFRRELAINLAVGCSLAVILQLLPDASWLARQRDVAIDGMIRLRAGLPPESFRGAPFVFLDVDEPTWRRWGEPFHVPRDRLAELMRFALTGGARLLLVDVELSRPAGPEDREIERLLAERGRAPDGEAATPIVLARGLRAPLPGSPDPWPEERASFLDAVVARTPGVYWASTLFLLDPDRQIRRFRNLEPACTAGRPSVVPAMQLLGAALVLGGPEGPAALAPALAEALPPCGASAEAARPTDRTVEIGGVSIALAATRISGRVLYAFGADGGGPPPAVPFRGGQVPLLTRLPAHLVTGSSTPPAPELVADRVVVIGASHADGRDLHATPLGPMPGAVIVANAVHSLVEHGGLRPPPAGLVLACQLALIAAVGVTFAAVRSAAAAAVATPLLLALLLPASFWLFRQGVWLDLAIPVLAVQGLAMLRRWAEGGSALRARLRDRRVERARAEDSGG